MKKDERSVPEGHGELSVYVSKRYCSIFPNNSVRLTSATMTVCRSGDDDQSSDGIAQSIRLPASSAAVGGGEQRENRKIVTLINE